jgi:ectoine hydroxylase-related dioxygenase (phytanoyl-CoA dioxygenase family)
MRPHSLPMRVGIVGKTVVTPELERTLGTHAARDPMHPDIMTGLGVINIDMEPGDLMIFNSPLAHGVRPSHSDNRVRMAQYISMHPAEWGE